MVSVLGHVQLRTNLLKVHWQLCCVIRWSCTCGIPGDLSQRGADRRRILFEMCCLELTAAVFADRNALGVVGRDLPLPHNLN